MTAIIQTAPPVVGDLYQVAGPEGGAHQQVEVVLHPMDEAGQVKARLAAALEDQCGHQHWVSAKRRNQRGSTVLHWKVEGYCWPEGYAPQSHQAMREEADGIVGLLRPADRGAAERAADDRRSWAAEVAVDATLRSRGLL